MVENTGKKTKLQTQRPTVVNLPAILIGAKWQTVKDSATSSASHSLLAFNKAIYTFLLGLLVACCFPKGSADGLKSVDNVPTCHAELFLEILLRRRMPLPEACQRPGHVHFPEEDGRTSAFASETAFVPSFRALDCSHFIGNSGWLYRQFFTTDYITVLKVHWLTITWYSSYASCFKISILTKLSTLKRP